MSPHVPSPNTRLAKPLDAQSAAMAASYRGTATLPHGLASVPRLAVGSHPSGGFLARERDLLIPQQHAAMPDGVGLMVRYDARAQTTHVAASETVVLAGIGAAAGLCFYALYLASRRRHVN